MLSFFWVSAISATITTRRERIWGAGSGRPHSWHMALSLLLSLAESSFSLSARAEALDSEGRSIWIRPIAATTEAEIEAYVQRSVRIDPDLWVVDIEDSTGRHFLVEPVAER